MLVKFQEIKQDIKQGMMLDYFFTYYKYEVGVTVLRKEIFFTFICSKDKECVVFTLPKDEYMKMKYKDFLRYIDTQLYYYGGSDFNEN